MKVINRTGIVCMTLMMLVLPITDVFAQENWATNGDNIHNTNTGNVGIGTSTPGAVLELKSAGAPDFIRVDMTGAGRGIAFERVAETPSYNRTPILIGQHLRH